MNIKKSNKKIEFIFLLAVVFQILLLINLTPADSYIISQTNNLIGNSRIINEKDRTKNLVNYGLDLLIGILSIKQLGIVSAEEVTLNCCPETKRGAICQDIASTDSESCAVTPIATSCDEVSNCERGCCIDEEEGLCTTRTTKQKCEGDGGIWNDEESCLIQECQKGCCVLGGNVKFATEKRCEHLSLISGLEKDFRDYQTEIECLNLAGSQIKGACVFDEDNCKFVPETECLNIGGTFFQDKLCSNTDLNTICKKQASIGCAEGKAEIYWFDSCGNKEGIYSSDKGASWNNGKFLSKEESCNPEKSNADSETCGNCDGFESKCSKTKIGETHVKDGNYVCKDMNCIDKKGNERANGESWCVYDSYIGEGKDTPGSRHWKASCYEGKIEFDGCADYRGEICVQSEIKEDEKTFSTASCVMNEAPLCLGYNSEDDMQTLCNNNKDCMIKNINIDKSFKFDMCVGKYPKGFDLRDSSGANNAVCSMASQTCSVVYQKDWKGSWKCKENCNCVDERFTKQMNDLCISLGDCGSYVNYIGGGTDNIKVSGAPSISWKEYKKYVNVVEGQFAKPQSIENTLYYLIGTNKDLLYNDEGGLQSTIDFLGTISGASASLIHGAGYFFNAKLKTVINPSTTVPTTLGAVAGAAIGATIGSYVGIWIAGKLGISGNGAAIMTLSGGVAGAAIGYGFVKGAFSTQNIYVIIIAVAIMVFIAIIGWGKTKTRKVEFTCMPWQAPIGGDNCKKCNNDALKPCTKYRCNSLGQACKLLNENTENSACVSIPYEPNPPVISPKKVLTKGFDFFNKETKKVEIRQEDKSCILEWTPVLFTMGTDEYAQCKFDFERKSDYESMDGYPIEQTVFGINHTFGFSMPSLDSLEVYNVTGNLKEKFGNMNMYIRCKDSHGNFNIEGYAVNFCINSGHDLNAAYITKHTPEDKSYIKYNSTSIPITIYLNEPAECKYDVAEGKRYDDMSNSMLCKTEITEYELYGWPCNTTLTNLTGDENKIYIKCKDKPWVVTKEDIEKYQERNVNSKDFVYDLYKSESDLKIDSVSPEGIIESGFEPVSVDLEVKTSGGAENGKSVCYWGRNFEVLFLRTNSDYHKQALTDRMKGDYDIPIKCEDVAGNTAYKNIKFKLDVDSSPPIVVRVYKSGGNLKIITDEKAECYYNFDGCYFNIDNSTSMTFGLSTKHAADWTTGKTYYIKCRDVWGNTNPNCAIQVSPSFFV